MVYSQAERTEISLISRDKHKMDGGKHHNDFSTIPNPKTLETVAVLLRKHTTKFTRICSTLLRLT